MAERKQFPLRIDPRLWTELEAWAADDLRSVNGQIEYILREATRERRGAKEKGSADEGSAPKEVGSQPARLFAADPAGREAAHRE